MLSQGKILRLAEERFKDEPIYRENLQILQSGDESLCDLVDTYLRIARQDHMPEVACFFEQRDTNVGAILGKNPTSVS